MLEKSLIEAAVSEYLATTDLIATKIKVTKDNDLTIFIHRKGGSVCIDDCVGVNDFIRSRFDSEKEDYSLTVSSAGSDYRDEDEE